MNSVMLEAIHEVLRYNLKLIPAIENTVEHFRAQREDQALSLLVQIVEGLNWEFEVIFMIKGVLQETDINIDQEKTLGILSEMTGALESQDYVLIADLFEYEILPFLKEFQEKMGNRGDVNL
ncbi:MAG: hypothetical protein N3B21_01755 [Clostridia bacterium]|nr:hypothetical protein [Clostridia bacterium]